MTIKAINLITYGLGNTLDVSKIQPIRNWYTKPTGGLWASPIDSEYGWVDWGRDNEFGKFDSQFTFRIFGNIFVIDGLNDLRKMSFVSESYRLKYPDYEELVSRGYDAIHLTVKGQDATRFSKPDLYGWDCESVLIMNPACIMELEQVR